MSKVDAVKFVTKCQNWSEIAIPIATHKPLGRVILKDGLRFESPFIHWPDIYTIFFTRVYTPPYLPIEKNDIVVDIGANIGIFTLYAAAITQNTVYAFEPFPSNFEALQQNIRANGLKNVIPFRSAVSDQSGIEVFADCGVSQGHRLKKVFFDETDRGLEVPTITLQDFMDTNNLERIDFLKLDCEGAEGLILQSTPKSYLQRIRKISMEFHDQLSILKHDQMKNLLEEAGFTTRIRLFFGGGIGICILQAWRT